jgi:hypothetical protein
MPRLGAARKDPNATVIAPPASSTNQTIAGNPGPGGGQPRAPRRREPVEVADEDGPQLGISAGRSAQRQRLAHQVGQVRLVFRHWPPGRHRRPFGNDHRPRVADDIAHLHVYVVAYA